MIPGFREAVNARQQKKEEMRSAKIGEYLKIAIETVDKKNRLGATTQLTKPRLPPLWSGQKYDRWKIEVEKWFDNNKSTDEEKYIDLLESLKKNDAVKEFVVKTLVEKVGNTRTVKKILEVMTEKFAKTTSEKTSDMMKKISGNGFKSEDKIDVMIDRFEEMITETENIRLAENLRYAMSLQFWKG